MVEVRTIKSTSLLSDVPDQPISSPSIQTGLSRTPVEMPGAAHFSFSLLTFRPLLAATTKTGLVMATLFTRYRRIPEDWISTRQRHPLSCPSTVNGKISKCSMGLLVREYQQPSRLQQYTCRCGPSGLETPGPLARDHPVVWETKRMPRG